MPGHTMEGASKETRAEVRDMLGALRRDLDKEKKDIQEGVWDKWGNKYKLMCPGCICQDGIEIRVRVEFRDGGFPVGIYKWPKINSNQYDWNLSQGTKATAAHEVGHFLGNIDEYNDPEHGVPTSSSGGSGGGTLPRDFGQAEQKGGNVMNNPTGDATKAHYSEINAQVSQLLHLNGVWCDLEPIVP